jgi:hypothetical protein
VFATIPHGVIEVLALDGLEENELRRVASYDEVVIALDLKRESVVHIAIGMDHDAIVVIRRRMNEEGPVRLVPAGAAIDSQRNMIGARRGFFGGDK